MGDDSPETVERRSEFAQLLRDLAPELRDAVCQVLREYEQLTEEQRAKVLRLGEALLQEARSEAFGDVCEAQLLRYGARSSCGRTCIRASSTRAVTTPSPGCRLSSAAGRGARDRGPRMILSDLVATTI